MNVDVDPLSLVSTLVEVGGIDTVYRDLYLGRAHTLLTPVISVDEFRHLERQHAVLAQLPLAVARALEQEDWAQVKALSYRADALKQAEARDAKRLEAARSVYAASDVALDPFCPSLHVFTRMSPRTLPGLRAGVVERLTTLEQSDVPWRDFYACRRTAFHTLSIDVAALAGADEGVETSAEGVRKAAAEALKTGNMKRLAELADLMPTVSAAASGAARSTHAAGTTSTPQQVSRELAAAWSTETLAHAGTLGLAPRHLESRAEFASLRAYAWTPSSHESWESTIKRIALPSGAPEGLRDAVAVFMLHPMVNSGGARYVPTLVAEDVLVEDFPDPQDEEQPPVSPLLTTLGLPRRRGLTRTTIERALLAHGTRVLEKELGLDPRVFRLLCIPPDVYIRVGEAEGWGRQACWTHFDGCLIRTVDGRSRLQALVGGDVRYGGLYDLLGVSRDYDSDRLIARFAVVHRERMAAW
jgi:hypothetical protein